MPERTPAIVAASDLPALDYRTDEGPLPVACRFRALSDAAGLSQMGVKIREIEPGHAGTHLHYHDTEEEWAYVLSGKGRLVLQPHEVVVRAGHFAAFPPGPAPHHFIAEGDQPLVLIEGGERRRDEDWCVYPALGVRSRNGADDPIDVAELPTASGRLEQVVHLDDLAERSRPHPLAPDAIRHQRPLAEGRGLSRQACAFVRLEAGGESTVYHTHDRTDEWVYVLSGELDARIGGDSHRVRAGDFIGHPAGGPAHVMRAHSEATYLMGGQSLPGDVVTYPERDMILGPNGFEKLEGDD